MKTADERLRAAARDALDMFPPGGDLPPLRLPDLAGGPARAPARAARRGALIRTGRTRAWMTPLAAAAAVAVVIAGVVAAHPFVHRAPAGHGARPTEHAPAATAQQKQRQALDALVVAAFAPATGPQYDLGSKLNWMVQAQELKATARCMAASGYHIGDRPAPFDLAAYADNTQLPDLPRIARTSEFVSQGSVSPSPYPGAEQKVFSTCQAQAQVPYRRLMAVGGTLDASWWNIVSRIQASAQVKAAIPALNACATRYGFPHDPYGTRPAPITSFADFMDWIAGFLDGAGSRGASAGTLQALSRHWSAVFVTCARPIVGIWQRLQLAAQPGFLEQHAGQVRQLDQLAWQLLGRQSG
jgi:hypothetical protein